MFLMNQSRKQTLIKNQHKIFVIIIFFFIAHPGADTYIVKISKMRGLNLQLWEEWGDICTSSKRQ